MYISQDISVCLWSACLSACSIRPIFPKFVTKGILSPLRVLCPCLIWKYTPKPPPIWLAPTPQEPLPLPFHLLDLLTGLTAMSMLRAPKTLHGPPLRGCYLVTSASPAVVVRGLPLPGSWTGSSRIPGFSFRVEAFGRLEGPCPL